MSGSPRLSFSHIGLYVANLDTIVRFYTDIMGFHITDRGTLGEAPIVFLSQNPLEHHQIVFIGGNPAGHSAALLNQMSFRLDSLASLLTFAKRLEGEDVSDLEPVIHGNAWSLYFRDPEGNRVEVFADSDWYIAQPIKKQLDLAMSEEQIRKRTLEFCRNQPGFRPIEEWRNEMRLEMESKQ